MARIVDVALSRHGAFTQDDVVGETRGEVSRATVYRSLALMVQADVLRLVSFNGREVFVAAAAEV
jgi:Fe2+ or Zn2+ uptake regulation protein